MAWEPWQRAMHTQCLYFESVHRLFFCITFHNISIFFFKADNAFPYLGGCFSTLNCYYVPSFIFPRALSLIFLISSELLKNLKSHGASYFTVFFFVSRVKVKFSQKLLLMPSTCCLGLHIHPASWMSLQPVLDPTLACHTAGSEKHMYTAVTPLNDYGGGTGSAYDPEHIFLFLWKNNPALAGCWSFQPEDLLDNLF